MANIYTPEIYSIVLAQKTENVNYINRLYSAYPTMTFDDKLNSISIVNSLKNINIELDKYITIYQQIITKKETKLTHTVVFGDTLPGIAQRYFGDYRRWQDIFNYNLLSDIQLTPGQQLIIPENN